MTNYPLDPRREILPDRPRLPKPLISRATTWPESSRLPNESDQKRSISIGLLLTHDQKGSSSGLEIVSGFLSAAWDSTSRSSGAVLGSPDSSRLSIEATRA